MFSHSSASGKYTASVRDACWSSTPSGIEFLLNTCTQLKCSQNSHIVFYFWEQLAISIIRKVCYAQIVTRNFWILAVCILNSVHHSLDDCVLSSGKDCIISFGLSAPSVKIGLETYYHPNKICNSRFHSSSTFFGIIIWRHFDNTFLPWFTCNHKGNEIGMHQLHLIIHALNRHENIVPSPANAHQPRREESLSKSVWRNICAIGVCRFCTWDS